MPRSAARAAPHPPRWPYGIDPVAGLDEVQLLGRFASRGDAAAFEALIARHGPMVLGVCRRHLRDRHAVEDAFQATFLILVRRAGSIRHPARLGNWLHGVALRVASRARARSAAGALPGLPADLPDPAGLEPAHAAAERREFAAILDEELARLPEALRAPLVLCALEGLSHEQAADRLRCPIGTVRSRMARARERLRRRLSRCGIAPATLAGGALFAPEAARAALPPALLEATLWAGMALSASPALLTAGPISAVALDLTRGVLQAMTFARWKLAAGASLLFLSVAGSGAGVLARQDGTGTPEQAAGGTADRESAPQRELGAEIVALEAERDALTRSLSEKNRRIDELRRALSGGPATSRRSAPHREADDRLRDPQDLEKRFRGYVDDLKTKRAHLREIAELAGAIDKDRLALHSEFLFENLYEAQGLLTQTESEILQAEADVRTLEAKVQHPPTEAEPGEAGDPTSPTPSADDPELRALEAEAARTARLLEDAQHAARRRDDPVITKFRSQLDKLKAQIKARRPLLQTPAANRAMDPARGPRSAVEDNLDAARERLKKLNRFRATLKDKVEIYRQFLSELASEPAREDRDRAAQPDDPAGQAPGRPAEPRPETSRLARLHRRELAIRDQLERLDLEQARVRAEAERQERSIALNRHDLRAELDDIHRTLRALSEPRRSYRGR